MMSYLKKRISYFIKKIIKGKEKKKPDNKV